MSHADHDVIAAARDGDPDGGARMNLTYQLSMHLAAHMRQWPRADREQARRDITRRLTTGQAWLWPEPVQMEMFA